MTQVVSLEARFRATGVQEVKNGFNEIAKAAALAKREQQVAATNMRDMAKQAIPTQRELARMQERQARAMTTWAKNAVMSWGAASAAVGYATKAVYDFGKSGAQLQFTQAKFDRLAKSAGSTGNIFLNDLRRATKGTISDFKAMELGANLLQLGLSKNTKEAGRLAGVMTAMGMDVGEVTLALANQSTRRLDQLGISLTRFNQIKEQVKRENPNLSKEDLFTEAFLRTGEATIATTGNMADTQYGTYLRTEAQIQNIKDQGKLLTANALAPTIEGVSQFMTGVSDLISGRRVWDFNQQNGMWTRELPEWAQGNASVFDRMKQLRGMGGQYDVMNMGDADLRRIAGGQMRASLMSTRYQQEYFQRKDNAPGAADLATAESVKYALALTDATNKMASAKTDLNNQLEMERAKLTELQNMYGANSQRAKEQADVVRQVQMEVSQANAQMAESSREASNQMLMAMIASAAGEEEAAQRQLEFAFATGMVTQEAYKQQSAMMGFASAFANTSQTAEQAAAMTKRFYEYLSMLDGMTVEAYLNFVTTGNLPVTGAGGGQTVVNRPGTPGSAIQMEASGGSFSGWAITGDSHAGLTPHSELVYAPHGAYVYNASQTRAMLNSGFRANRYATGGFVPGSSISLDGVLPVATTRPSDLGITTTHPKPSDYSTPTISSFFEQAAPVIAQDVAQVVTTTVVAQIAQSFQAAQIASAKLMTDKFDEMIYLMRDNPRAVGENVGSQLARRG